jgi:chromosome condensin MukBEF ATPase and DNA-binding subunit MukB
MKYVIDKLSDLGIIKVTVSGTLNQNERKEILTKTVSELNTNGYHRVLIDLTASKVSQDYKSRTINTFDMVHSIKKIENKNPAKIALLSTPIEDNREHFVKLAQFSGKINVKHFSNYDEAITWLLGGKDIFD